MKITRKTMMTVKTVRQFITRQLPETENVYFEHCAERMMTAQMSAELCGIGSRAIYRLIKAGAIHFAETEHYEVYVCPSSVKRLLPDAAHSERAGADKRGAAGRRAGDARRSLPKLF